MLLLATLCLGSCAQRYHQPSTPPPSAWSGAFGLEMVPGTLKVNAGTLRVGDVLIEHEARFKRTGIVVATVKIKDAFGGDFILPQGALAYAMNYSVRGPIASKIDPIEWCVILPHGINGKDTEPETVCVFWESDNRASYVETYIHDRRPFQTWFYDMHGMPGPVPVIAEQPVDFGKKFWFQLRILKIEDDGFRLEEVYSDGKTRTDVNGLPFQKWPGKGNAITLKTFGQTLTVSAAGDFKSVQVIPLDAGTPQQP